MSRLKTTFSVVSVLIIVAAAAVGELRSRVLDAKTHHLGRPGEPEWQEFEGKAPDGRELIVRFEAEADDGECTAVIGNEVTTKKGHFNAFPIKPGSAPPDYKLEDWPPLMHAIRSTPGVRVVVLNHPRNIHSDFQPFGSANYNAVTGENRPGLCFAAGQDLQADRWQRPLQSAPESTRHGFAAFVSTLPQH